MDRANDRRHTHPILAEEWEQFCKEKGLPAPRWVEKAKDKRRDHSLPAKVATKLESVFKDDDSQFCLFVSTVANDTVTINNALKKHAVDGCREDGSTRVDNHYFKLVPQLVGVTDYTLRTDIHPDAQAALREWWKPKHEEWKKGKPSSRNPFYALVWMLLGVESCKTNFSDEELAKLPKGGRVKHSDTAEETSVTIVVSARKRQFASRVSQSLKSVGTCQIVVKDKTRAYQNQLKVHASPVTVVCVDDDFHDAVVGGHVIGPHQDRILLLAEGSDDKSAMRLETLCDELHLGPHQRMMIDSTAASPFAPLVAKVSEWVDQTREAKAQSRSCHNHWLTAKAGLEQILGNNMINPESLLKSVISPFYDRVTQLDAGTLKVKATVQTDFIQFAKPIFRHAKAVYATSTDTYSTFWNDANIDQNQELKEYLAPCPTVRLFLFSKPSEFVRGGIDTIENQTDYYEGLSKAREAKGHSRFDAKLLVGSLHKYKDIPEATNNRDVAFIEHDTMWHRFHLNEGEFEYKQFPTKPDDPILKRLEQLGLRASQHSQLYGPKESPYVRWGPSFREHSYFFRWMKDIFVGDSCSGVHRVVLFRNNGSIDPETFNEAVVQVHSEIERMIGNPSAPYWPREIDYGARAVTDSTVGNGHQTAVGVTSGRQPTEEILILHFDSDDDRAAFADSHEMKRIRTDLYKRLLTALGVDIAGLIDPVIHDMMYKAGNRYVSIIDYTDEHHLDDLLKQLTTASHHS